MNQDYTESSMYLFIAFMVIFFLTKKFFLGVFIMAWKWIAMFAIFPLIYIPSFVSDGILFFWTSGVVEQAQAHLNILVRSNEYITALQLGDIVQEGVRYKFSIGEVNSFLTRLFSPYLLIFFLFYSYKNLSKKEFRGTFNIDSLIRDQADLWPVIKPMVEVFPHKIADLDEGPWAMGLETMTFAERFDLLEHSENRMGEKKIALKEDKVIDVFRSQLGKEWTTIEDLTQEEKFILSILITKANRKGDDAKRLGETIATAYTSEKKYSKKELKSFMDKAIKDSNAALHTYGKSDIFLDTVAQHYYIRTMLPRMLEMARIDGVLATADFIWLKIRDRTLWYTLNNVGRNASWIECAGIWHHFNYEKAIERKIPSPSITGAVAAIDWEFRNSTEDYIPLSGYNEEQ